MTTVTDAGLLPPLPVPDDSTQGYWDAARRHELAVRRCAKCGSASFPPWACCRRCQSVDYEWAPTSGTGKIWSWTTVYRSTRPEFEKDVPYNLAVVELDDYPGVLVPARLPDVEPGKVVIGTAVRADFDDITSEFSLLRWRVSTSREGDQQ